MAVNTKALLLSMATLISTSSSVHALTWADWLGKGKTGIGTSGIIPVSNSAMAETAKNIAITTGKLGLIVLSVALAKTVTQHFTILNALSNSHKTFIDNVALGCASTYMTTMLSTPGKDLPGNMTEAERGVASSFAMDAFKGILEDLSSSSLIKSVATGALSAVLYYSQAPATPKTFKAIALTSIGGLMGACIPALARTVRAWMFRLI